LRNVTASNVAISENVLLDTDIFFTRYRKIVLARYSPPKIFSVLMRTSIRNGSIRARHQHRLHIESDLFTRDRRRENAICPGGGKLPIRHP